ncbi:MAG: ATP-binding protein [Stenotrophomonas sp.]
MTSVDTDSRPPTAPLQRPKDERPLYREVFDGIGAGFCVIEVLFEEGNAVDYRFIEVNQAFERSTGLVNARGKRMRELSAHHEDYWYRLYGRVASEGVSLQFEREAHALGRWYSVDAVRIGDPRNHRVAVLFFDITQRKQVETDLAESEARFSALADGMPMPVWVLDDLGQTRFVNSAFGEFFGDSVECFEQSWWQQVLHPGDLPGFEYELRTGLKEKREIQLLARARRHDGQWRWLEMNAVPRFAADGRFVGLAGNSPDVTERREIELAREQLLQAERSARNAAEGTAKLKDEFLATLSHELRTPLTTILGWSELLLQRMDDDHPMRKGMSVIAASAMAQKRLISDMLDLSSMLLGKAQLEVETLDLAEQVREAVRSQELVAAEKGQSLLLQIPDLPFPVLGDATRLQQVLWNLVANAIKFTPDGGRIEVELQLEDGHYLVHVRDNGDGIDAEFLKHLFSRFSQADGTTTRRHGGLGLGLAIVQQLVELHGGTVAASSPGKGLGATFSVRLPAYQSESPGRPRREVQRGPIAEQVIEPGALRGLRLLAVEDQPDMRGYLCRLLEEQGADVVAVGSAAEALKLLGAEGACSFDVLLSDIGMAGMDGYGLLRILRENMGIAPAALPAVAVTALARTDDRRRALQAGFQGHLAKPYSLAQLVAAIRDAHCRS